MTDRIDIVDAVSCICPQIDFLADVLSYSKDLELTGSSTGGLSSILSCISRQLKKAIREVDHDTNT
jgi:hypothetical protein